MRPLQLLLALACVAAAGLAQQRNPVISGIERAIESRRQIEETRALEAQAALLRQLAEQQRLATVEQMRAQQQAQASDADQKARADRLIDEAFAAVRRRYPDFNSYFPETQRMSRIFAHDSTSPDFTVERYIEGLYLIAKYASFSNFRLPTVPLPPLPPLTLPPPAQPPKPSEGPASGDPANPNDLDL